MRIVLTLVVLAIIGVAAVRLLQSQLPNLSVTGAGVPGRPASAAAGAEVGQTVKSILDAGAAARASEPSQ